MMGKAEAAREATVWAVAARVAVRVAVARAAAAMEVAALTLLRSIVLCATSKISSSRSRARLPAVAGREGSAAAFFGLLFALFISARHVPAGTAAVHARLAAVDTV